MKQEKLFRYSRIIVQIVLSSNCENRGNECTSEFSCTILTMLPTSLRFLKVDVNLTTEITTATNVSTWPVPCWPSSSAAW